ncbi:hypothetical protein [Streptosporangium sp. NBC_01756]|uniref:hypothetical protein n=1 Tax=Streptosporangium sp. NBC_01756 TaxID=2975950 RepID=UPI002DD7CBFF|nr:hypothetical protein [Streptosporangium sp. NBC_01756]WSC85915.1 hypothetical protein OIE48_37050 [Streptosporangium sp. NBC_01756]
MSVPMEIARRVADAVLYEGYLLYPYRASAAKNRVRWQFGVLVPPKFTVTAEPSASVTECVLERAEDAVVRLRLRFLHVRTRSVERVEGDDHRPVAELRSGERTYLTFDEATQREVEAVLPITALLDAEQAIQVRVPGDRSAELIIAPTGRQEGRVVSEHLPLHAVLRAVAERVPGPYDLVRLRVRVENTDGWDQPGGTREQALRRSLVSAHLLIGVSGGAFVSLLDPPEWARPVTESCRNEHTWPVLVGEPGHRDVVLSSPIILYDYPDIAPESPGELFDSTEIDEILHLRTLTLTEEEAREARATDPRAARLLDMVGDLPPEMVERLHGVIRYLGAPQEEPPDTPWWDPAADAGASPETDSVVVSGVAVAKGSRVRLVPGRRRADAHDMFLTGRTARVEAVLLDLDGARHLAVTLDDDPGADLHRSHGRFLYFAPDEVEPLGEEATDCRADLGADSETGNGTDRRADRGAGNGTDRRADRGADSGTGNGADRGADREAAKGVVGGTGGVTG